MTSVVMALSYPPNPDMKKGPARHPRRAPDRAVCTEPPKGIEPLTYALRVSVDHVCTVGARTSLYAFYARQSHVDRPGVGARMCGYRDVRCHTVDTPDRRLPSVADRELTVRFDGLTCRHLVSYVRPMTTNADPYNNPEWIREALAEDHADGGHIGLPVAECIDCMRAMDDDPRCEGM